MDVSSAAGGGDVADLVATLRAMTDGDRRALEAALEARSEPCFVLGEGGGLVGTNARARALLEEDPHGTGVLLRAAADGQPGRGWSVRRLAPPGGKEHLVVAVHAAAHAVRLRVAIATSRWGLTPFEADVLALAATGHRVEAIAAALGCAERTIELHLSACLEKAGCEDRAQLVASVWREAGASAPAPAAAQAPAGGAAGKRAPGAGVV